MTHGIPVLTAYLERENLRDTDRLVRMRLVEELVSVKEALEEEQRRAEKEGHLPVLSLLGRVAAKLDRVANSIRYASRGYRGLFDLSKVTREKLEALQRFDEGLFEEIESLHWKVESLHATELGSTAFTAQARELERAVDGIGRRFGQREKLLG